MVSPKDRVKANIYKELLEQEKRKNKRRSLFSISLFFIGIFTSSTYQSFVKNVSVEPNINFAVTETVSKPTKKDMPMDHFFSSNLFDEKKIELNTDELFGLGTQI